MCEYEPVLSRWQKEKPRKLERCRELRAELVASLGGRCAQCGSKKKLEFHHKKTRTWIASQLNRWSRLKRYSEEIKAGLIELLCKKCNQRAGKPKDEEFTPDPDFVPDF